MFDDAETTTAFDTESPTGSGTEDGLIEIGTTERSENGSLMLETGSLGFPVRTPPIGRWKERDDFVRVCINMGLNGPQIAKLSLSTPQPMRTAQHVYDKIQSLGLDRRYMSRMIQRRRIGDHNRAIHSVFMKVFGQAMEYGYTVREVMRDACPHPGSKLRVDVGLRILPRLHFFEPQLSPMEYVRWHARLDAYVRLYERLGQPFRSNWLLTDRTVVTKVSRHAREVLTRRRHPNLNLFNFITLHEFQTEPDILKAPVWTSTWGDRKATLM